MPTVNAWNSGEKAIRRFFQDAKFVIINIAFHEGGLENCDFASLIAEGFFRSIVPLFAGAISSFCYNWLTDKDYYFPRTPETAFPFFCHSFIWFWLPVYFPCLDSALRFQCYVKKLYVENVKNQ